MLSRCSSSLSRPLPRHSFSPALCSIAAFTFLLSPPFSTPCRAAANEVVLDEQAIAQMEARASQADPREQCFLYTQLVHTMAEAADREMLQGDSGKAQATLKAAEHYAQLVQAALSRNAKRLKEAEKLMEHTTERLGECLRRTSGEDRSAMQATLKQLDTVHDQLLKQVFLQ